MRPTDFVDRWVGINILDVQFDQGLDILDARDEGSPKASRATGRPDFTKFNVYAAGLQALFPRWSLLVAANGQYAYTDLLSPEEFGVGGEQFGRAYDASEIVGDSGVAGKAELRFNFSAPVNGLWNEFTLYGFYDGGKVWQRNAEAKGLQNSESITSTGVGLRFNVSRWISGYVEVNKPLGGDVFAEGNDNARIFAALSIRH